jgi:phosphoribosylaminoimidazole-succinocarboxamide synthase
VPLEVIFRNSLPSGSSLLKRLANNEVSLEDLGLKEMPKEGTKLKQPILDVSTKLEEKDRYLKWVEAQRMAGLSDEKLQELKDTTLKVNEFLTEKAESLGLEHADGKIEFGRDVKGELMIVDVLGTLDENRFLYNGIHLSKQVLRDYYNLTPWKEEYLKKGKLARPPRLPKELITIVSNMYKSVAEAWAGSKIWNAPSIEKVVEDYQAFLDKLPK